jgi:hypothetical protein
VLQSLQLLIPALIPSWRFFDRIAPSPRIEFSVLDHAQDTPRNCQEFRPRPTYLSLRSMLRRMVWNPLWNESLFMVSCAERLIENPTQHSAQQILSRLWIALPKANYLQFRLVLVSRQGEVLKKEIAYLSPVQGRGAS